MKKLSIFTVLCAFLLSAFSCKTGRENTFWGDGTPFFEVQKIFFDERFPNVVVATDGTVIATWGNKNFSVRRSEDGGKTWGEEIIVANPGFQGGGTTVNENNGEILIFVEEHHPVAPLKVYKSKDHGKTWKETKVIIKPNSLGHTPSMHMNEHGITLRNSKYSGRLIRPSRYYGGGNDRSFWNEHYTNAIYSDDGGKTWQASEPFPAKGTGEATIAELSDGTLCYNSRRHKSTDGLNPRMRHVAWSNDGGEIWKNMSVSEELPDGDQNRDYGLMGGLTRLPVDGYDILLFSNIDSPEGRNNGTVWASFDGGRSWPVKKLVDGGSFAYSSMTAGREGTPSEGLIYLLYESDGGAKIARFNLPWLTSGRDWKSFLNSSAIE
ncbi:MAG: sialidase family protein [Prolixibacteraceae bacterium]|nr:sialidase family protein [Prolixibacteraceae bacterium]